MSSKIGPMNASLDPVSGDETDVITALAQWVENASEPLVIRTSGSTGAPKHVVVSHRAMMASAHATHRRLGGPGQWLLALPVSGIAGVQVIVRSLLAGSWPVRASDYSSIGAAIDSMTGTRKYASLVPTQVHRMAREDRLHELAALDALLIGGASLAAEELHRLRGHGVNVVRTYGMSETCGGCVYDGFPLDGVNMDIDAGGRVLLSGDVLFDGYQGDRAGTAAVMRDGWFHTADLGRIDDGQLTVLGRSDDVVTSGGVNVALPAVREAVRQLDGVHQVELIGVPDAEWGSRVVACIVPRDAVCLDGLRLDQVRDVVGEQGLPREWAPQSVVFYDALPLLEGGKIDRQELIAQASHGF